MPSNNVPSPPPPPTSDDLHKILPTALSEIEEREWFSMDLKTCKPMDICAIGWGKAVGFEGSEEGSEGVLFVQFEDKSVVAVKGSSTVAADVFAMELAIKTGTPVPKYKMLRSGVDLEYDVLSAKLTELDENNHPLHRAKHLKVLGHPIITIMEFIAKGKVLYDMELTTVFGESELSKQGAALLMEIARMTVFDIVINNWDRIPLIWDNAGNPDNILFTNYKTRQVHPIAIDSSVTSIDPATLETNFLEYVDKVRFIINEICEHIGQDVIFQDVREKFANTCEKQPSIQNFRHFFKSVTQYDVLKKGGLPALLAGLIEGVQAFSKITLSDLTEMRDDIEHKILECLPKPGMTCTPNSLAMYKVNIDFLDSVLEVMRIAAPLLTPALDSLKAGKIHPV